MHHTHTHVHTARTQLHPSQLTHIRTHIHKHTLAPMHISAYMLSYTLALMHIDALSNVCTNTYTYIQQKNAFTKMHSLANTTGTHTYADLYTNTYP